jgi:hypothetical protein
VQAAEAVTPAQVCGLYDEAFARIDPMIERALPAAVEAVQSLTLAQVNHIERKYAKVNSDFRDDYLQNNPAKRLQESVKRTVDRAETLYGGLDAAQLELLTRAIAASPFDPQLWLSERMLRQQDVLKTLRRLVTERAPADHTQAALRMLVLHAQRSPREIYLKYQERLLQYNCKLAAQLHNSTSREQRQAAVKKLRSWEEDARALSGDTVKAP